MAGLQYYFFPTDFFYPRPSSANGDNASKPVLQVQTQKAGAENIERCKIVVHNDVQGNNKLCYQPLPASTSCTALYNLFPLDFFYPPQPIALDATHTATLPLRTRKRNNVDNLDEQPNEKKT
uniref:Uncharacterized protein n=1 Tax=Quercus lobata TaxID=97700 RepID=A0A7N2R798_QUELO